MSGDSSEEIPERQSIYRSVALTLITEKLEKMSAAELLRMLGRLEEAGY